MATVRSSGITGSSTYSLLPSSPSSSAENAMNRRLRAVGFRANASAT
jgi:hypothetical protein